MLSPGTQLSNRYRILQRIGGGGMGEVYLAEDTRLSGRHCAIKALSLDQIPPPDRSWLVQIFQQEAAMLAQLSHPHLTNIYDYFAEGGQQYLVMELVKGETLEARLARESNCRLSLAEALAITGQLCDVLGYLHGQQPPIVFRDLKPGNIMLTPQGQVKLIDFGIARLFKPGQTRDTMTLGTPGYAAPEQYGGKGQTDPRSDIYSLGVVLHEMLTGYDPTQTPFNLPITRTLNAGVPARVEGIIRKATQIDPDRRFQTVQVLQQQLFAVKAGRQRRVWGGAAVAGLLAAVALGGFMAWDNGRLGLGATPIVAITFAPITPAEAAPTATKTAAPKLTATETRQPTATLMPSAAATETATETATPTSTSTPKPMIKTATAQRTNTPASTSESGATPAAPTPTRTAPVPKLVPGKAGRVLFTTDLGGLYLYSVDPAGGPPEQLGQTDRAHSTCNGGATVATADNQTIGVYRGPYCAMARLGECRSPDGRWLATYSAKGRSDGSGTIITSPANDETQNSFVVDGMVNASKGILWTPDSSGFIFYIGGNFYFAVPGQDGFRPVGAGEIISWSPDSTMLLIKELNDIGVQYLDGRRQLLINGQLISNIQCPIWRGSK